MKVVKRYKASAMRKISTKNGMYMINIINTATRFK